MLTYNNFLNLNNSIIEQNLNQYTKQEIKLLNKYLKQFNNELFILTQYQNIEQLLIDRNEFVLMSYNEILIYCKDNNIKYENYNKELLKQDKKIIEKYLKQNNLFFIDNFCICKVKNLYYLCIISLEKKLEIIDCNENIFKIFIYLKNDLYNIKDKFVFSFGPGRPEIKGILKNNNKIIFIQGYYEL